MSLITISAETAAESPGSTEPAQVDDLGWAVKALVVLTLIGSLEGFGFIPVIRGNTVLGLLRAAAYLGFVVLTFEALRAPAPISRPFRTPLPLVMLVSLAGASILIDDNLVKWGIRMIVLIGSLAVGWIFRSRGGIDAFLRLVIPVLVGAAVLSLLVAVLVPAIGQNSQGAWVGVFVHKNDLGRVAALLVLTVYMGRKRGLLTTRMFVVGMALGGFLVVMSDSATVLIVIVALVPTSVAASLIRRRQVVSDLAVGLVMAVVLGVAATLMLGGGDEIFNTVFNALGRHTGGNSLALRRGVWTLALDTARDHFWTGQGVSFDNLSANEVLKLNNGSSTVLWDPKHAHNSIIDVWLRIGFFGVVAALWFLVWLVARGFVWARSGDGSVLLLALTLVGMSTTFSVLLAREVLLWLVVTVVAINVQSVVAPESSGRKSPPGI